ncbi:hypothetical protein [Neisseria yangbaofengii]|uniref:hypothetical protein n=1 Tax=Neisseria yangbaofengii TaxID=2709396 RepID=UPI001F154D41|nr:hypothetical protein [Neisseria yangbaofengii]
MFGGFGAGGGVGRCCLCTVGIVADDDVAGAAAAAGYAALAVFVATVADSFGEGVFIAYVFQTAVAFGPALP